MPWTIPLITLETDKATMDVPAEVAGVVKEVKVKVGDKISEGGLIAALKPKVRLPLLKPKHQLLLRKKHLKQPLLLLKLLNSAVLPMPNTT